MNILGIETSCDETAVAVVKDGKEVLSSVVASSHEFHAQFGGILPELASRKQLEFMIPTLQEVLKQYPLSEIDAVAVTVGPGLIGSLLIGVECAKTIAMVTGKPIVPVNHVLAHPYANFLTTQSFHPPLTIQFPAIALVVSGGHTELFLMNTEKEMKWLGGTIDDAAGEAFDKSARLLGLGNGGGKALEELAAQCINESASQRVTLPRPLLHDNTLNFSFSGLKTAIQRAYTKINDLEPQFAYEIQEAITDVLVKKTLKAATQYSAQSILLGGGVSANKRLREKFIAATRQQVNASLHFPSFEYCTDNAAVIASYAYYHYLPQNYREISASPSLSVEI